LPRSAASPVFICCSSIKKRGVRRQAVSVRTDALFALDFREWEDNYSNT